MLGAIIGDVVGSYYEVLEIEAKKNKTHRKYEDRIKILDEDVPLFTENSSVTDDSVLTCAVYDAIINGHCDYETYLRKYGEYEVGLGEDMYGRSRFGKGFVEWLNHENNGHSWGNGAAMRISAVGFCFDDLETVKSNAELCTRPSHNHPDSLRSAEVVAVAIFLLRQNFSKDYVKKYVIDNYYPLDYDLMDLQKNYKFTSKASESVPQALFVFFNSNSFEDSIRKAISIGGDSDTIAAIVGSLSEAHYGIPTHLKDGVRPYLRDYMYDLLQKKYYDRDRVKEIKK